MQDPASRKAQGNREVTPYQTSFLIATLSMSESQSLRLLWSCARDGNRTRSNKEYSASCLPHFHIAESYIRRMRIVTGNHTNFTGSEVRVTRSCNKLSIYIQKEVTVPRNNCNQVGLSQTLLEGSALAAN